MSNINNLSELQSLKLKFEKQSKHVAELEERLSEINSSTLVQNGILNNNPAGFHAQDQSILGPISAPSFTSDQSILGPKSAPLIGGRDTYINHANAHNELRDVVFSKDDGADIDQLPIAANLEQKHIDLALRNFKPLTESVEFGKGNGHDRKSIPSYQQALRILTQTDYNSQIGKATPMFYESIWEEAGVEFESIHDEISVEDAQKLYDFIEGMDASDYAVRRFTREQAEEISERGFQFNVMHQNEKDINAFLEATLEFTEFSELNGLGAPLSIKEFNEMINERGLMVDFSLFRGMNNTPVREEDAINSNLIREVLARTEKMQSDGAFMSVDNHSEILVWEDDGSGEKPSLGTHHMDMENNYFTADYLKQMAALIQDYADHPTVDFKVSSGEVVEKLKVHGFDINLDAFGIRDGELVSPKKFELMYDKIQEFTEDFDIEEERANVGKNNEYFSYFGLPSYDRNIADRGEAYNKWNYPSYHSRLTDKVDGGKGVASLGEGLEVNEENKGNVRRFLNGLEIATKMYEDNQAIYMLSKVREVMDTLGGALGPHNDAKINPHAVLEQVGLGHNDLDAYMTLKDVQKLRRFMFDLVGLEYKAADPTRVNVLGFDN